MTDENKLAESDHDMLVSIRSEVTYLRKDVETLKGEVKTMNTWFNRIKGAGYLLLLAGGIVGFFTDQFWTMFK